MCTSYWMSRGELSFRLALFGGRGRVWFPPCAVKHADNPQVDYMWLAEFSWNELGSYTGHHWFMSKVEILFLHSRHYLWHTGKLTFPSAHRAWSIIDLLYKWHMRQVYSAIIPKLDHLEHLSICFQYSSFDDEHAFDLLHSLHFEALSSDSRICCHRALKTVQIDVRLPSSDPDLWYTEDQFYFMKKKDKIVPASSLDSYYKF